MVLNNGTGKNPLFNFAYHPYDSWLETVRENIKAEPWGQGLYILKKFLQVNFEIAQSQGKIYENFDDGVAFWRPGYLINEVADPVWLKYIRNRKSQDVKWFFNGVCSGDSPYRGVNIEDFQIRYEIPEFDYSWRMFLDQQSLDHIFEDPQNYYRLKQVFGEDISKNRHLIFRVLFGEISLQQRDVLAVPQWYHGGYHFLVPLFLTQPNQMELAATLTPNEKLNRYDISTLLLPGQAYGSVRPVARSRKILPQWLQLSSEDIARDNEINIAWLNQSSGRDFDDE